MVRVLNFFFCALAGMACLAIYHVSEQTRVAQLELSTTKKQIVQEQVTMKVLQADWLRVADPARIQRLAQLRLGLSDAPMKEYASLQFLPRIGQALPGSNDNGGLIAASVPVPAPNPGVHLISVRTGN